MSAETSYYYWTDHAAERFLERGIDLTTRMVKWLDRVTKTFTSDAQKYTWGKGKKQITIVGKKSDDGNSIILTIY